MSLLLSADVLCFQGLSFKDTRNFYKMCWLSNIVRVPIKNYLDLASIGGVVVNITGRSSHCPAGIWQCIVAVRKVGAIPLNEAFQLKTSF